MNKLFLFVFGLILSFSSHGATMSCALTVAKAAELEENADPDKTGGILRISLSEDGAGEATAKINGEEVFASIFKRPFADVYEMTIMLETPKEDRVPKTGYVTRFTEHLVNEGPAKNDGWTVDPGPGATRFDYLIRRGGSIALTPKLRKAMESAGLWGEPPFTSNVLPVTSTPQVAEVVEQLVKQKLLKKTDVVAISTVFSCTRK